MSDAGFLLRQQRPCLPKFGEEFLVQCEFQVRRSRTSSGSHARANHSLHQLDVAQPPTHNEFIEFRQPLADVNPVPIAVLVAVQRQYCVRPSIESLAFVALLSTCSLPIARRASKKTSCKDGSLSRRSSCA